MLVVLGNLKEGNPNSKNYGKAIIVNVPDEKVAALNAIRQRAANFAQRIVDAD